MKLKQLSFSHGSGGTELFGKLDLEFPEPGISVILGPSGQGKTTLLRILGGLVKPVEGTVEFGNTVKGFSWVFQEPRLLPWLNLRDNVLLPHKKKAQTQIQDDFTSLVELLDLHGHLHKYPHELSGGMKSRASILRSLLYQQPYYLWDEPFAGLDRSLRDRVIPAIKNRWNKVGASAVLVLHDQQDAELLTEFMVTLG